MKIESYINNNLKDIKDKTFIITGANSGIGFEMVKVLLSKEAKVVLACRNEQKVIQALNSLKNEEREHCFFAKLDQSDFDSIDAFIVEILNKYPDFEAIILNAGIFKPNKESYTKQGFRSVIGTNYLGVMYLVEKLKQLDKKGNRKIVFQSSLVARNSKYKKGELLNSPSTKAHTYSISKIGVDLYFQDCLINDKRNKYYLAEPGICYSNIYSGLPKFILPAADCFMKIMFHSPKKGGLCALSLAINDLENGTILIPRGIFHFSGYPKKVELSNKIKKSRDLLRDGKEAIKNYL